MAKSSAGKPTPRVKEPDAPAPPAVAAPVELPAAPAEEPAPEAPAAAAGRPPLPEDEVKSEVIHVRVAKDVYDRYSLHSVRTGVPMAEHVRQVLILHAPHAFHGQR